MTTTDTDFESFAHLVMAYAAQQGVEAITADNADELVIGAHQLAQKGAERFWSGRSGTGALPRRVAMIDALVDATYDEFRRQAKAVVA